LPPLIKVCGFKEKENIEAIASLNPDYMGFIFFEGSKRKADVGLLTNVLNQIPKGIKKVGVFVNETENEILRIARILSLDCVQLHGNEPLEIGKILKNNNLEVWKVFGLQSESPNWEGMKNWLLNCDVFLFDTASTQHGGTGLKFDHHVLKSYPFEKPFWLSGGIGPDFTSLPQFLIDLPFIGLDINSKFETEPGLKNIDEVKTFVTHWKS
jgi:phosphoribosylanthranilate isomerase